MTGDWDGSRSALQSEGVNLRARYTTESAYNPIGGKFEAVRYTQQIDFGADLDLDKLIGVTDARIQITLVDRIGRSLSADAIGNLFAVQELYGAGQNFRLAEFNYQQDFFDHALTAELGWSPMGDDFATSPFFCDFQNGVICGHANAMTTNSGAHNFPTAQWGARIKVRPSLASYTAIGIYQVNPNAGNTNAGFNMSFRGTGVIVPLELGWLPGHGSNELPGNYKVGAYYNSSDTPDVFTDVNGLPAGLTGAPFATRNGRYGAYVMADQTLYRETGNPNRSLTIGATAAVGDRATAKFGYYLSAGGVLQGTFVGRDQDFVSAMIAYARLNDRLTRFEQDRDLVAPGSLPVQTYESILEIDYGAQVTHWLSVRPNLQYVIHPGATGKIPDALVMGLYTRVTL